MPYRKPEEEETVPWFDICVMLEETLPCNGKPIIEGDLQEVRGQETVNTPERLQELSSNETSQQVTTCKSCACEHKWAHHLVWTSPCQLPKVQVSLVCPEQVSVCWGHSGVQLHSVECFPFSYWSFHFHYLSINSLTSNNAHQHKNQQWKWMVTSFQM